MAEQPAKGKKEAPIDEDSLPEQSSDHFEEQLVDAETALAIHKILHELPEPYKEVFTLRVFGELTFQQIAELFGKSESWAKMTYYRGKSKILSGLEEKP